MWMRSILVAVVRRPLQALQIEVTSRCRRRCAVCARTALSDRWLDGDLSDTIWRRLRPGLQLAGYIHLQGWGEPLLHPGLRAMVRDVHGAGSGVGITTNGDRLLEARTWIVEEGVDVLAVSLAGVGASNRRFRDGADAEQILEAVAGVARDRGRSRRPRLHLSFLLLRENAAELPELVRVAARCGVGTILVNHLDCLPTSELFALSLVGGDGLGEPVRAAVLEAAAIARVVGVELRRPPLRPRELLTCDSDPMRFASVRWDGRVGPCVQQTMSIEGPVPRWSRRRCRRSWRPRRGGDSPIHCAAGARRTAASGSGAAREGGGASSP